MKYSLVNNKFGDEVFAVETERLRLSVYKKNAADKIFDYAVRNREFHRQFSQPQPDSYYTYAVQKQFVEADLKDYKRGAILPMWITMKTDHSKILGRVSLFNIARGGMMLAQLGYHLDKDAVGNGIMTEAVTAVCALAFEALKLHRIEAFILPENERSISLIKRCGFVYEGKRYSYMNINGKYRDHETYFLLRK